MVILGAVLCALGVLFVALGFAGACKVVFAGGQRVAAPQPEGIGAFDPEKWATLIKALVQLVKVAPAWFLCVFTGVALVAIGVALISTA
jgi:hypothetical protein